MQRLRIPSLQCFDCDSARSSSSLGGHPQDIWQAHPQRGLERDHCSLSSDCVAMLLEDAALQRALETQLSKSVFLESALQCSSHAG